MTTPSVGDIVLVRCVVVDITPMVYNDGVVLDVKVDGRVDGLKFSVLHEVHTQPANQKDEEKEMTATTTYTIHRNNRRFNSKKFNRYEEARSYVRAWLRRNTDKCNGILADFDYSWNEHRNPSIQRYGFSIKRSVS